MITEGVLLNQRYRLDAEIGRGGMGRVFRAQDTLLGRLVAVKVLNQAVLDNQGDARWLNEAQAAARLNHPNIVSVYDAGTAGEASYIVMELVEGKSLYEQRPESMDEIIQTARQICSALEHAHSNGIIHRDLKPENVLMTLGGTAKLMDFGLARSVASRLSQEGAVIGTVFYLAPEQALGKPLDGRADLYALGVMLYEMSAGQLPFSGNDPFTVITQHLHAPPVPPRAKNEAIPPALEALILQLLNKEPQERPASASVVNEMLEAITSAPAGQGPEPASALSLLDRIARGRIVSRESELAEAGALWERARRGEGQFLLVSGEPGVGKTRLVREVVTRAEVSGSLALAGECYAEGGAPFGPFAQIARSALSNGAGEIELPDFIVADLLLVAPDLRIRFPNIPPNPPLDPQAEKSRLFENMVAFCQMFSQHKPLLLLLEDVHWADSGTLHLLHHLARRTRRLPILLVATYREVELDQARPLQSLLHDLNRERLGSFLKLTRLDKSGVDAMLRALFSEDVTPEFLNAIYHETEGNPFFIEEVCKAMVESGKIYFEAGHWQRAEMSELDIPQSIRVAIQSRVGNLPLEAQDALALAAVLGRQFDYELLASSAAAINTSLDENRLIQAMEDAVRAQLIEEVGSLRGGTFRFTHALIPSILSEALSGPRRRRYHRQVTTALESLRPDDLESLAYHSLECGDLPKGMDYSLRAARKAYRIFALDEALHRASHALDAAEELDQKSEMIECYELMGNIHLLHGAYALCYEAYQKALDLAGQSPRRIGLAARLGNAYTSVGDPRGLELLKLVITEADPQTQANDVANATAGIGRFHHYRGQHRQALEHIERAFAIAEPYQDQLVLTTIHAYLAGAHQHLLQFQDSMQWSHRLIAFGEQNSDLLAVAIGNEFLAEDYFGLGQWQETLQYADQDRIVAIKIGAQDRIAWAGFSLASGYYGMGDLAKAAEIARSGLELAELIGEKRLEILIGSTLAQIQADMGNHEEALHNARQAQQRGSLLGQLLMSGAGNHALAYCLALQGEWQKSLELMDAVDAELIHTDNGVIPLFYYGFYGMAALEAGEFEKAERITLGNLELTRRAGSRHYEAEATRVLAQIRSAQGKRQGAAQLFTQAMETFTALGSRLELGKAWFYFGQAQSGWGDGVKGGEALQKAGEIFKACGAKYWEKKLKIAD